MGCEDFSHQGAGKLGQISYDRTECGTADAKVHDNSYCGGG